VRRISENDTFIIGNWRALAWLSILQFVHEAHHQELILPADFCLRCFKLVIPAHQAHQIKFTTILNLTFFPFSSLPPVSHQPLELYNLNHYWFTSNLFLMFFISSVSQIMVYLNTPWSPFTLPAFVCLEGWKDTISVSLKLGSPPNAKRHITGWGRWVICHINLDFNTLVSVVA